MVFIRACQANLSPMAAMALLAREALRLQTVRTHMPMPMQPPWLGMADWRLLARTTRHIVLLQVSG